jgi:hypothetical protein
MRYGIYVYCDECFREHPMGVIVDLPDGPGDPRSIGQLYNSRPLPEVIAHIVRKKALCPKTGKFFVQDDQAKIFVVPENA